MPYVRKLRTGVVVDDDRDESMLLYQELARIWREESGGETALRQLARQCRGGESVEADSAAFHLLAQLKVIDNKGCVTSTLAAILVASVDRQKAISYPFVSF